MRTHYNLPLPFARPAPKEPLDCYRRSANRVSQTSVEKPCLASTGRLYTARGPFKDLISRRRWIKIRTSSFLKSKCIIVRFRAMDARPPRGESLVATAFESEPLTRCRSTATSRRGNFRPDGPYWADSRSFERLSRERRGTANRRLCAATQNSCPFARGALLRRLTPMSSENL